MSEPRPTHRKIIVAELKQGDKKAGNQLQNADKMLESILAYHPSKHQGKIVKTSITSDKLSDFVNKF